MSATYFNRTINIWVKLPDAMGGDYNLVETVQRHVREMHYGNCKYLVRYKKQWRNAVKADEQTFSVYL